MIRKEGTFLPFFRNKKREEEKSRKFESGSEKKKFKRQSWDELRPSCNFPKSLLY